MRFETVEEVAEYFDLNITLNQYIDIANYIRNGIVPAPDGCTSCDRGVVRRIIGMMKQAGHEDA